ncbi:MAG: hypothetical protein U0641_09190 [Anaerolineae bacterium]
MRTRGPLDAAGLCPKQRLEDIHASIERVAAKGLPAELQRLDTLLTRGLEETAALWPDVKTAHCAFEHRAAHILANHEQQSARGKCARRMTRC